MQGSREIAIEKIEEINLLVNRFIESHHEENDRIKLFSGLPGAALFLYYYAQYNPAKADEYHEKIASIIEDAFEYISKVPNVATSFCTGITGVLWLTEFMRKKGVIDIDDDYLPPGMIEYLARESLMQTLTQNNCDLLHGGFGFWAYLLESNLPNRDRLIHQQLEALNKIAVDTPNGRNWKINYKYFGRPVTYEMVMDPYTTVNLSLAHGVCAILILLTKTKMHGLFERETADNIHQGLSLLRSLKITEPGADSLYPAVVINGEAMGGARLAWCYGDLCVANAFWMAAEATGYQEYRNEALSIMDFSSKKDFSNSGVKDAGLCHGSSGVAHIFRRFYLATGNAGYQDAADRWMAITFQMATHVDGYAGYKSYRIPEHGGFIADYSFLEGVTGIGLALLSSLSDKHPDWDRILQIS
jgi:lantibiotic biosynthesis protein